MLTFDLRDVRHGCHDEITMTLGVGGAVRAGLQQLFYGDNKI